MGTLSTREVAIGVWSLAFLVLALLTPGVRNSLPGLFKALLQTKIVIPLVLLAAYVVGVVWSLRAIGYWDRGFLKDTILWFFLAGIVAPFSLVGKEEDLSLFQVLVVDNLKVFVLLEFLVTFYTFGLPLELALVPVITFIAMLDVVAERQPEHFRVSKLLKGVQAVVGLGILSYAISEAVADYHQLASLQTLRLVILPPLLSLALVPAAFLLLVWAAYDELFVRFRIGSEKEPKFVRYAKLRLVRHLGLRPSRVARFRRAHAWDLTRTCTRRELDSLLEGGSEGG